MDYSTRFYFTAHPGDLIRDRILDGLRGEKMNQADRKRLLRLWTIIESVPFPHTGEGTKTASLPGFASFANDIKSLRPGILLVLSGMILQGSGDAEEGWDYEDPDKLLDDLEGWIEKRRREAWRNTSSYDFRSFRAGQN